MSSTPYLIHIEFDDFEEPTEAIYYSPEGEDKAINYAGMMSMYIPSTTTVVETSEQDYERDINDE